MKENKELRYLVQCANELRDNCKIEIADRIVEESDMQVRMSKLVDDVNYSDRSIRGHIKDSKIIHREQESYGRESLVYVSGEKGRYRDDVAKKALKVSLSCLKVNEMQGIPFGGDEL